MSVRNCDLLFRPRSVAVIGASHRPHSVGHVLTHNLVADGFAGPIYAVHPHHESIDGLHVYRRIADLPELPDLALIAIPAPAVPAMIDELGAAGVRAAVIISSGFREAGEVGATPQRKLVEASRRYEGFRILGPNCLGFVLPRLKLNASFTTGLPPAGRIAFVSQSGALCSAVLDWAQSAGRGFSYFISLGNMLDVDFADVIDFLADDEDTDALVVYVEAIERARDFVSAARACTRRKPIVIYKAGRNAVEAETVAAHTGARTGSDAAYEAAFRRAALVRVFDSNQLFGAAELLTHGRPPAGPQLAIVTNAGGPGVMAADALIKGGGQIADLTAQTIAALDEILPTSWSHRNPVNVRGEAGPEKFAAACATALADNQVDALLAILTPQALTRSAETAAALAAVIAKQGKLVLACWMGQHNVQAGRELLSQHNVPTFDTPEEAARAFTQLVRYTRDLEVLYQAPRAIALHFPATSDERRNILDKLLTGRSGQLDAATTRALLDLYEITRAPGGAARTPSAGIHGEEQVEFVIRCQRDQVFGPLISIALGGIAEGLLHDESFELPPLSVERVVELLLRVSALVSECAEIEQLEFAPLLVTAQSASVGGAQITLRPEGGDNNDLRSFSHLSIAPYPDRLARTVTLKDRSSVVLRPIRPDDTELWHEMLDAASERSILFRFRSLFRQVVHRQAARYCFIDYDREMAFVAEAMVDGRPRLVGVGRLVSDNSRENAEFGILVIDAWQGRGLGGVLLDACLDYAQAAKYIHIYAQTSWDNERMIRLFRQRGFHIERYPDDPTTLRATRPAKAD